MNYLKYVSILLIIFNVRLHSIVHNIEIRRKDDVQNLILLGDQHLTSSLCKCMNTYKKYSFLEAWLFKKFIIQIPNLEEYLNDIISSSFFTDLEQTKQILTIINKYKSNTVFLIEDQSSVLGLNDSLKIYNLFIENPNKIHNPLCNNLVSYITQGYIFMNFINAKATEQNFKTLNFECRTFSKEDAFKYIDEAKKFKFENKEINDFYQRKLKEFSNKLLEEGPLVYSTALGDCFIEMRLLYYITQSKDKNIVVCCGSAHIKNISHFLDKLNYKVIENTGIDTADSKALKISSGELDLKKYLQISKKLINKVRDTLFPYDILERIFSKNY